MNKKLCCILFSLFMCLIFINNVYADEVVITIDSNANNVVKGENREITIKLNSDKVISSCQFKVENDSNITYVDNSAIALNNWNLDGNVNDGFVVTKPNGSTVVPNGGILKLGYVVNGNGKFHVKDIKCVIEEGSVEKTHGNVEIEFTTIDAADDTMLKSLRVKEGTEFDFKSDVFENYYSIIERPNFTLEFETNNPDYQDKVVVKDSMGNVISDINNITFRDLTNQGGMPLSIIVNETTTYTLLVSYIQKTFDNSLEYIKINGSNITLLENKTDYVLEVSNDVNNINCIVALKDSVNFQIGKNSNINADTLEDNFSIVDTVDINIIVEPKDSSSGAIKKEYTIHIKKVGASTSEPDKEEEDVTPPPVLEEEDDDEIIVNPTTGDISMFVMVLILISSLIVSVILYRKNIESYK